MSQVEGAGEMRIMASEIIAGICDAIGRGMGDGSIRRDLDPLETAVFVMTTCENIVHPGIEMEWALANANKALEGYREHSMGLLVRAIAINGKVGK